MRYHHAIWRFLAPWVVSAAFVSLVSPALAQVENGADRPKAETPQPPAAEGQPPDANGQPEPDDDPDPVKSPPTGSDPTVSPDDAPPPIGTEPPAEPLTEEPAEPLTEEPAEEPAEPLTEEPAEPPTEALESARRGLYALAGGEYRFRFNAMSDIPLTYLPRTEPAETGALGENYWGEQWLRFRGELGYGPKNRLIGQFDLLRGVAFGDLTGGVTPATEARDELGYPGFRLRHLYLEERTPFALIRVGQMGFDWGLGMLANSGERQLVFGDYRYGDLVRRVFLAAKPGGQESPLTLAAGLDWITRDLTADTARGDVALQGLFAIRYHKERIEAGSFLVYRSQTNALDDELRAFILDAYARWRGDGPRGGTVFAEAEAAFVAGDTTYPRTTVQPEQAILQGMGVIRAGWRSPALELVIESGYASGDSNSVDGYQRRATMDPDHRVGLIMFPEVIAWQTARAAHLAQAPELAGRPSRGSELLPTNGGVAGAAYLFPHAIWRPARFLDARLGGVLGVATSDVVDPFMQSAYSSSVNFRGGDPSRRNLGLELDASLMAHTELTDGLELTGGIEGGLFLPGGAFDDAMGESMDPIGLVRARLGLRYR